MASFVKIKAGNGSQKYDSVYVISLEHISHFRFVGYADEYILVMDTPIEGSSHKLYVEKNEFEKKVLSQIQISY